MTRFEGLSDSHWELLKELFPHKKQRGYPRANPRKVLNTILWVLITGARWCDVPVGSQWAPRSTAHGWLGIWQENGTLDSVLFHLQELADMEGLIDWERLAADGFFSPR